MCPQYNCNKQKRVPVLKIFTIACILFFTCNQFGFAQAPVIRNSAPKTLPHSTKPKIKPVAKNENLKISSKVVTNALSSYYSLLNFADQRSNDYESHDRSNFYLELTKWQSKEISDLPESKNWSRKLLWRKIPKTAAYGRWEISLLPFPPEEDSKFTGVIRKGLVETKGADSLFFTLNYSDVEEANLIIKRNANNSNNGNIKLKNTTVPENQENQPREKTIYQDIKNDKAVLSQFQFETDGPRKFYIRIVPLDERKMPLRKISNDIVMQEVRDKALEPPPLALYYDYVITDIKYVPVHFPDPNFQNCVIVTGYNDLNAPSFFQQMKDAFPIGRTFCPEPPEDKPWYEKVFNSVTGFIKSTIDGAANFYNSTKQYVKDKFKELNCHANGTITLINPVSKLQEVAGPDVCEAISGAAFDYGMVAVGIPPTLPNSDDLTKMAEGQIVDLACDKIESETGAPVPEFAREQIRNQTHEYLTQQASKGTINSGGYVNFKAHPLGQFQTAYLQVEVTRVSKKSPQKGIVDFPVSDYTSRTLKIYDDVKKKSEPLNVFFNLFEKTTGYVPYLENIGDKTIVYIILKPQDSYAHYDVYPNKINGIRSYPTIQEYPPDPTYEGNAYTTGFQILCGRGSTTKFNFGLKKADAVNLVFTNN